MMPVISLKEALARMEKEKAEGRKHPWLVTEKYEAVLRGGELEWLGDAPSVPQDEVEVQVAITRPLTEAEIAERVAERRIILDEIRALVKSGKIDVDDWLREVEESRHGRPRCCCGKCDDDSR